MTWREAIDDLEAQARAWAPEGVRVEAEEWIEDPSVKVIVFKTRFLQSERRVTLAPVAWKRDEVPTAADLYSSRGQRLRLQGPDDQGRWLFLTPDLLPLDVVSWDAKGFGHMLDVLLKT